MKNYFTHDELLDIASALRLRMEACEENEETRQAKKWGRVLEKLGNLFPAI